MVSVDAKFKWQRLRWYLSGILFLSGVAVLASNFTGKRIVDDTLDISNQETRQLQITFNFPFHFQLQSPLNVGEVFLIALHPLRPITGSDIREHVHVPWSLTDIISRLELERQGETYMFLLETHVQTRIVVKHGEKPNNIIIILESVDNQHEQEGESTVQE